MIDPKLMRVTALQDQMETLRQGFKLERGKQSINDIAAQCFWAGAIKAVDVCFELTEKACESIQELNEILAKHHE